MEIVLVQLKIKVSVERVGHFHLEDFLLTDSAFTLRERLEQGFRHRKWSTATMRTMVAWVAIS